MPPLLPHDDDEIARARTLYEETALSPHDIARLLGVSKNTFYRRVGKWGWRRRRYRVLEVEAAALDQARSGDEAMRARATRVIDDRRAAEDRAEAAIVGQIAALEAMQERVALAAFNAIDSERGARTIYRLAQALTEVFRARAERAKAEQAKETAGEGARQSLYDEPEDLDEMRERLADKLERLIAQGKIEAEQQALRDAQG